LTIECDHGHAMVESDITHFIEDLAYLCHCVV